MIRNRFLRAVAIAAAVAFTTLLLASTALVVQGMSDDIHEADVAVVLGNTVNPDGTPSHRTARGLR